MGCVSALLSFLVDEGILEAKETTTRRTARDEDEGLRGMALEGEPPAPAGGGVAAARRDDEAVRSLSSNSDRAHKVLVSKKKTRTRRATRP